MVEYFLRIGVKDLTSRISNTIYKCWGGCRTSSEPSSIYSNSNYQPDL